MSLNSIYIFVTLWVLLNLSLSSVFSQEVTVSESSTATTEVPKPKSCINGQLDEDTNMCMCFMGWTGELCDSCLNSRLRLTEDSGLIFDGSENYQPFSQCLFYIEANSSVSAIHLRLRSFHTECQWDALSVFNGDSIFHPKIAAYTGDIIELPLEDPTLPVENATTPPPTLEPVPVQYQDPREITLSGSGSQMLLYFYTDAGIERPGFEIAYWVDYACPDNCSGQGVCENGSCVCDPGWTGTFCHITVCPNNCSENGVCDTDTCVCSPDYTGLDCSISVSSAHWERVDTASLPDNLTLSAIARSSHSAIVWGDHMLVYGGYQFPIDEYYYRTEPTVTNETVSNDTETEVFILRYHFSARSWDKVTTYPGMSGDVPVSNSTNGTMSGDAPGSNSTNGTMNGDAPGSNSTNGAMSDDLPMMPTMPRPRYGHTSVVYNDTMYVYGGTLLPTEQITNEFWALDLNNFTWTLIPSPSTSSELPADYDAVVMESESAAEPLPLAVRSHTSHVVGNRMITLFGLSPGRSPFLSYVQEYNFDTGRWSLPRMRGVHLDGRMGHTSVLDPESGLIYVHGGAHTARRGGVDFLRGVITLDTSTYTWSSPTNMGPLRYLHSSILMGPLLVIFGGCEIDDSERDCFQNDTHVYNTRCGSWEELTLSGLPGNSSRYGHSSVLDPTNGSLLVFGGFLGTFHHDLLRLNAGNCSVLGNEVECVSENGLCAWSGASGECVSVESTYTGGNFTYHCPVDPCLRECTCSGCNVHIDCVWNTTLNHCHRNEFQGQPTNCSPELADSCSYFSGCIECENHDCSWGRNNDSNTMSCVNRTEASSPGFIPISCPTTTSCFAQTSCSSCTCLWCPSLSQCVPNYPLTYIYAQCLGWVSGSSASCPQECEAHKTCGDCEQDSRCGWCNDVSNTGLGQCVDGGFTGPRENGSCDSVDLFGRRETWYFDQCPACQCNGHSACVNESVCVDCENRTTGETCDRCEPGYFGDARNGGNCTECDCNGYNPVCDEREGTCTCLSFFVDGDHCDRCQSLHGGDADNFCYATLSSGFIYSFSVNEDREIEGFFVVTPPEDKNFHLLFEVVAANDSLQPLTLQLFLGKQSENLWLLANITDPILLKNGENYETNLVSFNSNSNSSSAQLFTFTNPSIRDSVNFTELLMGNSEDEYTRNMWDGDVSLVIFLSDLTNPSTFRITVDQQDLLFLLYFFATFTICFSVLLLIFLAGWYIKKKIEYRAFVRAQYIELRRRVARPFARLKTIVSPVPPPTPDSPPPAQHPTYVAVETCRTGKAAILSLFVRLPGDHKTGRPCPGRSGLAIGTTLVSVNPSSKKPKDKSKSKKSRRGGSTSDEEHSNSRHANSSGNPIRLRDVSSMTTQT